jgi:hypothetical protein
MVGLTVWVRLSSRSIATRFGVLVLLHPPTSVPVFDAMCMSAYLDKVAAMLAGA